MKQFAHRFDGTFVAYRFAIQVILDAGVWSCALFLAVLLRLDFDLAKVPVGELLIATGLAVLAQLAVGVWNGLYVHRWRYATLEEVLAFVQTTFMVSVLLTVVAAAVPGEFPLTAGLIAATIAVSGGLAFRFMWRNLREGGHIIGDRDKVIVFGAGDGGTQIMRSLNDATSPYEPVAILDDNPALKNLRIRQVPVLGGRDRLIETAARTGATKLIVAIPSAGAGLLRELRDLARLAELELLVLPPVSALFGAPVQFGDVRPLSEQDVLGRRQIDTDIAAVAGYVTGRRVLVTGAGGSIGSELVRQLTRFAPDGVVMLDRDESALQALEVSLTGTGLLNNPALVVACIRDAERMREVFDKFRPEVVFHAAALKHLPLLEMHPDEGFKTNVLGTQNLLALAAEYEVTHFVNISTDKAADPTSVLGRTKRVAERLTSFAGASSTGVFISVRFGNVLGSRGSVLPLFREQIERGGPVTVTDPDVSRYFMTIEEACQLVIQAGAVGKNGQALVLDMGQPIRIVEVARQLIEASGKDIEIVFTGLREGEKLSEALSGERESLEPTSHPLINCVDVAPLSPDLVQPAVASVRSTALPALPASNVIDLVSRNPKVAV